VWICVYFISVQVQYCLYLILQINITNLALSRMSIVHYAVGNKKEWEWAPWEFYGNGNKSQEWEWEGLGTKSLEWEGMRLLKPIPVTSVSHQDSPLWELMCHIGSQSVTCHPAELIFSHLPQPVKADTHFMTPERCETEFTQLSWFLLRWYTHLKMVTHLSTNQAQCRVTLFMLRMMLLLH